MRLTLPALAIALCIVTACGQSAETADAPAPGTDAAATVAAPAAPTEERMQSLAPPDLPGNPDAATLGAPDARVTIIEYASTTCPHCANFHETLFPHIKREWIDSGRVKLVMRPLPTAPAQLSVAGFLLAACSGPDRYFDVLGELFATQPALFAAAESGAVMPYFEGVAANHGMSPDDMEICFSDESRFRDIDASVQAASADMVSGTPSFVINDRLYTAGELTDPALWDQALQAALDAAGN